MSYIEYTVQVFDDGSYVWFLNGKHHRENGPAIEFSNGDKSWYLNGKLHREDGPAVVHDNGNRYWYVNGKRHREDGPAIEYSDGGKCWYLNGGYLTESEFNAKIGKSACDPSKSVVEIDGKKYKLVLEA